MASKNKASFAKCIAKLSLSCSSFQNVEILVKIDVQGDIGYYEQVMRLAKFAHKVVFTPETGYTNLGKFHNDLSLMANGEIIWLLTDDFFVSYGDWVGLLQNTRNIYADNIYAIYIDFGNGKWFSLAPAVSREWVQCLGYITFGYQADYWVAMVAKDLGRYIKVPAAKLLINHTRTNPHIDKKSVKALHVKMYNEKPNAISKLTTCMKG